MRIIAELVFVLAIILTVGYYLQKAVAGWLSERRSKEFFRANAMQQAIQSGGYTGIDVFLALHGDSLSKKVRQNLENLRAERYADSDGGRATKPPSARTE